MNPDFCVQYRCCTELLNLLCFPLKKWLQHNWYQWPFMVLLFVVKGYKLESCKPMHWLGVFILFHSLNPLLPPRRYLFLSLWLWTSHLPGWGTTVKVPLPRSSLILDCSRLLLFLLKLQELEVSYQSFIPVTWGVFYVCIQVCLYDTPGSRMISASPFQAQKQSMQIL